jgi:hypothetical protein
MNEELSWVAIGRDALPGVIAEGVLPNDAKPVQSPWNQTEDVFVGLSSAERSSSPVVIGLNATSARDTLAWLAAYSGTSFPLSQSLRSFSTEDLRQIDAPRRDGERARSMEYWPSIILGELLGQGEYSPSIDAVAISRANACYSLACARTYAAYGRDSIWWADCATRLDTLESSVLFVKRAIGIRDLLPIWSHAVVESSADSMYKQLVGMVKGLIEGGESWSEGPAVAMGPTVVDARMLGTGHMESRVRSFQAFLQSLRGVVDDSNSSASAMMVAAAAVMVGNGTSHIALLEEFGKRIPTVFAWFGLFAAVLGPKGWDPSWNRAVNSVARLMRARGSVVDPPAFDLSWVEYDFVRAVPKPREFLKHIPKLYPRLLSVEVVPGASCQFRIYDETSEVSAAPQRARESGREPGPPAAALQGVARSLLELEHLLTTSRGLVQRTLLSIGEQGQPQLFGPERKTPRRGKAGKAEE